MRMLTFKELVNINAQDHQKTAEYVEKNHVFIKEFIKNLALRLTIKVNTDLVLYNNSEKFGSVNEKIGDFITIKNDCFFEFQLLFKMSKSIDINFYGQSFLDSNLAPLSGVILVIAIKQHKNSFTVRIPAIEKEKVVDKDFVIRDHTDNQSLAEIFNSCFEVIQQTVERGLEKRISELNIPTNETSKKVIKFYEVKESGGIADLYQ
jgi:hypothetical protein